MSLLNHRRRGNEKQFFLVSATVLTIIFLFGIPISKAFAHANPVSYSPSPNTIFKDEKLFPSSIKILFSERPDPKISYIIVFDSKNQRIDNNDFLITGQYDREATVKISKNKLTNGVYTVSWLTMSLDDGHIAKGSYIFGIGNNNNMPMKGPFMSHDDGMDGHANNQQQQQLNESASAEPVTSAFDGFVKWPLIVSQVAIVGGLFSQIIFTNNIWRRTSINDDTLHIQWSSYGNAGIMQRFLAILIICSIVSIIASTGLVFLQAFNLTNAPTDLSKITSTFFFLLSTPVGMVWLMRTGSAALLIAMLFLLYFINKKRMTGGTFGKYGSKAVHLTNILIIAGLIGGALNILANSIVSHASASPFLPAVAIGIDWLHFMCVSIWIGGLFYFSIVILPTLKSHTIQPHRNESGLNSNHAPANIKLALLLPRFSIVAVISLGIIGITGIYMAWMHLVNSENIIGSAYGIGLIIKLLTVLPMIMLGTYHQVFLYRKLVKNTAAKKRPSLYFKLSTKVMNKSGTQNDSPKQEDSVNNFSKTLKIESVIGILALLAASFLTVTSPPSIQAQYVPNTPTDIQIESAPISPPNNVFEKAVKIRDVDTRFQINPFYPGFNTFNITLTSKGLPPKDIANVILVFTNKESDIGPISINLDNKGQGKFSTTGAYLSQAGKWEIRLVVQRTGAYDLNQIFDVNVKNAPAAPNKIVPSQSEPAAISKDNLPKADSFAQLAIILSVLISIICFASYRNSMKHLTKANQILNDK